MVNYLQQILYQNIESSVFICMYILHVGTEIIMKKKRFLSINYHVHSRMFCPIHDNIVLLKKEIYIYTYKFSRLFKVMYYYILVLLLLHALKYICCCFSLHRSYSDTVLQLVVWSYFGKSPMAKTTVIKILSIFDN